MTEEIAGARLAPMGKSASVIIIGNRDGDHVAIEPLAKVESGWRTANLSVKCGPWTGHFAGQFMVGELAKFGKEIGYLCDGMKTSVEFKASEHYLNMKMVSDSKGRIVVDGEAREQLGGRTALGFDFVVERGALGDVAKALAGADKVE